MYISQKQGRKMLNELIPYNDCFYKHIYEYEYIALLDIDEGIMPVQDTTWQELMNRVLVEALKIGNETSASYNVRNVYFLDDVLHSHGFFKRIPRLLLPSDSASPLHHCIQSYIIVQALHGFPRPIHAHSI